MIEDENHLKQFILYIHNNPKHHGVVENIQEYKWSSYSTILSESPTKIQRDKVLGYFDGRENFALCHQDY